MADRSRRDFPAPRGRKSDFSPTFGAPTPQKRWGFLAGLLVLILAGIVTFLVIIGIVVVAMMTSVSEDDMLGECTDRVAEWAGVDPSDVSGASVSDENFSGTAWDFRGSYPTGDWACGGPVGERLPSSIMVYPGGTGSTAPDDIPTEIYSNR